MAKPDLSVRIGSLTMQNPVTVASGTYGYGAEYADYCDPCALGGIFLKGLTLEERRGNIPQRLVETPSGLLNAIGLQNVGFERFVKEKVPYLEKLDTTIFANICGSRIEDYVELARKLADIDCVHGAELNISCPNVKAGGMAFGCHGPSTEEITRRVREAWPRTLVVKLSPNVTDIQETARAAETAGADAIAVANTFVGMAIDLQEERPKLGNVTGGLSGPAVKPLALRLVWQCAAAVQIPIIGQGGISTWQDAAEFILAGASAISIGTANFVDPRAPVDILTGLEQWLRDKGRSSLYEAVGALKIP